MSHGGIYGGPYLKQTIESDFGKLIIIRNSGWFYMLQLTCVDSVTFLDMGKCSFYPPTVSDSTRMSAFHLYSGKWQQIWMFGHEYSAKCPFAALGRVITQTNQLAFPNSTQKDGLHNIVIDKCPRFFFIVFTVLVKSSAHLMS